MKFVFSVKSYSYNTKFLVLSVQSSLSHVQLFLWPHGLQHARLPCPSPTPGAGSNLRPSSQGCHPNIWCSVIPFFSCPQSFSASGSFPVSQLFTSGGLGIGASASDLPMHIQDWSHRQILLPLKRMREGINSSALSFLCGPGLISTPHASDMERCMSVSVIVWPAPGCSLFHWFILLCQNLTVWCL